MGEQYNRAKSDKEICKAITECRRGSAHKYTVAEWYVHRLTKSAELSDEITAGRYKLRPGMEVRIYHPKKRIATAPYFRDRVWQRSMCNNGLYDDLTMHLLPHNSACQKGKGTDYAIRGIVNSLKCISNESVGGEVWGAHIDVRQYFPSTPHRHIKELDRRHVSEPMYIPYLDEIIDCGKDKRDNAVILSDSFGRRGTDLGSQINQLHQTALLHDIDCAVQCEMWRYMDDFLLLGADKEIVRKSRDTIMEMLGEMGFKGTGGEIFRASRGFNMLGKRFYIAPSGRIAIKLKRGADGEERRTLRKMCTAEKQGKRTRQQTEAHYQSWIANASYCTDIGFIRSMDKFYTQLFRRKPNYKLKRRELK